MTATGMPSSSTRSCRRSSAITSKKISDVRIIFRSGYGKERDTFRRAVEFGFDKERIRFFGTCHTKGIVIDKKRVLLGSQNWTGAGTKPNRDASLLIENEEAAQYF